jgi:hypothetical protein
MKMYGTCTGCKHLDVMSNVYVDQCKWPLPANVPKWLLHLSPGGHGEDKARSWPSILSGNCPAFEAREASK